MYDDQDGESEWSTAFPSIPYHAAEEAAQFQVFLSDLSVDSLMGSWLEVGSIAGWVKGDDLPKPVASDTLTASSLEKFLPGISAKYGSDSIVDLHFDTTDLNSFTSSAANQEVTVIGSVNIQFWPRFNSTTELAVQLDVEDIKFTGGIAVNGFFASANITTFLVDKILIPVSTVG